MNILTEWLDQQDGPTSLFLSDGDMPGGLTENSFPCCPCEDTWV